MHHILADGQPEYAWTTSETGIVIVRVGVELLELSNNIRLSLVNVIFVNIQLLM